MKGKFIDENNFVISGYRVSNEIAESKLYIYKDNEFVDIIDMPDWWQEYLFTAQKADEKIDMRFEEYIIEELGIV